MQVELGGDSSVTIIIPTYRRLELTREAIKSAISQEYDNLEIVVSDNDSDDGSFEKLQEEFKDQYKIRFIRNNKNLGPAMNWLSAASIARGDYIKVLFSDDLMSVDAVNSMVRCFGKRSGFVISACCIGNRPWIGKNVYCLNWISGAGRGGEISSK